MYTCINVCHLIQSSYIKYLMLCIRTPILTKSLTDVCHLIKHSYIKYCELWTYTYLDKVFNKCLPFDKTIITLSIERYENTPILTKYFTNVCHLIKSAHLSVECNECTPILTISLSNVCHMIKSAYLSVECNECTPIFTIYLTNVCYLIKK